MTELIKGSITINTFQDMRNRYNQYVKNYRKLPAMVFTVKDGMDYIPLNYFDVMVANHDRYVNAYKKEPETIWITTTLKTFKTSPPKPVVFVPEFGYFINPEATPLTNIDFVSLKNKGITCIYYRIFNDNYTTHADALNKIKAAGLKPYAWVWEGFLYGKQLAALGWNICIDVENYNMTASVDALKQLRTDTKGKTLIICTKPTLWDGNQKWEMLVPICDYIMPMLYLGDYGKSNIALETYMQTFNTKYPGRIYPALETYVSDQNVVPKSYDVLKAEIDICKKYSKGIALFRYGLIADKTIVKPVTTSGTIQKQIQDGTGHTFSNFTGFYNIVKEHCVYAYYFNDQKSSAAETAEIIQDINGTGPGLNCVDWTQFGIKLAKEMGYTATPYGVYCAVDGINHAIFWIAGKEFGNGTWIDLSAAAKNSYQIGSHWCSGSKTKNPSWIPAE